MSHNDGFKPLFPGPANPEAPKGSGSLPRAPSSPTTFVLSERIERLEELLEPMLLFTPCTDCGVVFVDPNAYGEHMCAGRQGR